MFYSRQGPTVDPRTRLIRGVDNSGIDLELAAPRMSFMLLIHFAEKFPKGVSKATHPKLVKKPLDLLDDSTPITPPPCPPRTAFRLTASNGPKLTSDPSSVKEPCTWA